MLISAKVKTFCRHTRARQAASSSVVSQSLSVCRRFTHFSCCNRILLRHCLPACFGRQRQLSLLHYLSAHPSLRRLCARCKESFWQKFLQTTLYTLLIVSNGFVLNSFAFTFMKFLCFCVCRRGFVGICPVRCFGLVDCNNTNLFFYK